MRFTKISLRYLLTLILFCLFCSNTFPSTQSEETLAFVKSHDIEGEFYSDRYILILKSTKDYNEAVNFARNASKRLSLKFDNKNVRYSKEKGIYFEGINDPDYNGGYYPRRHCGESISLENSDGYE